jgi:hypothetical protein
MERDGEIHKSSIFGKVDKLIAAKEDRLYNFLHIFNERRGLQYLDLATEWRVETALGDAACIGRILARRLNDHFPPVQAAYRGIIFAHMVLDAVHHTPNEVSLRNYWQCCIGMSHPGVKKKINLDTQAYYYRQDNVADLVETFVPELEQGNGFEHFTRVGAALTFMQSEIDAAADELGFAFSRQIYIDGTMPQDDSTN